MNPDTPLTIQLIRRRRTHTLLTDGDDPELDTIAIIAELMDDLSTAEQARVANYINARWGKSQ